MNNDTNIKRFVMIALMSAIISVLSPLSIVIPISPVPISLATFAIYLTTYILGAKYGTISTLIYILLGMIGLPIFTAFTGGVAKIFGPTGGYIIGYIFLAIIAGVIIETNYDSIGVSFLGMIIGTIVLYLIGTMWLSFVAHMTFKEAILAGVAPFIPGDVVKMIIACIAGRKIRTVLIKAYFI